MSLTLLILSILWNPVHVICITHAMKFNHMDEFHLSYQSHSHCQVHPNNNFLSMQFISFESWLSFMPVNLIHMGHTFHMEIFNHSKSSFSSIWYDFIQATSSIHMAQFHTCGQAQIEFHKSLVFNTLFIPFSEFDMCL